MALSSELERADVGRAAFNSLPMLKLVEGFRGSHRPGFGANIDSVGPATLHLLKFLYRLMGQGIDLTGTRDAQKDVKIGPPDC